MIQFIIMASEADGSNEIVWKSDEAMCVEQSVSEQLDESHSWLQLRHAYIHALD